VAVQLRRTVLAPIANADPDPHSLDPTLTSATAPVTRMARSGTRQRGHGLFRCRRSSGRPRCVWGAVQMILFDLFAFLDIFYVSAILG